MAKYTVGLDIGTTKIVAMVGAENQYGKVEILGMGTTRSEGVSSGMVTNLGKTMESIKLAVTQAQANVGKEIPITEVMVGVAGQHIRSIETEVYIIRENPEKMIDIEDIKLLRDQIHKINLEPGEEIIHILPQEYVIDGQKGIRDPNGMAGQRLNAVFHVVLGLTTSIKNIARCVTGTGLKITNLTLEPLASAAAVLSEDEKEVGVALVDIGGGTTDLAIFKNGIIRYTAVIPFGGNIITDDVKEGCEILPRQAEILKVKFGSAYPSCTKENEVVSIPGIRGGTPKLVSIKDLSKIISARLSEIIKMVYNEICNYGHRNDDPKKKLIGGIVLTGGGSEMRDIRQLVEYITGMPTRIGYPNEHLASGTKEEISSPIYATSVGLVMTAIEHQKEEEDLLKFKQVPHQKEEETILEAQPITEPETEKPTEDEKKSAEVEKKSKSNFWERNFTSRMRKFLDDLN